MIIYAIVFLERPDKEELETTQLSGLAIFIIDKAIATGSSRRYTKRVLLFLF